MRVQRPVAIVAAVLFHIVAIDHGAQAESVTTDRGVTVVRGKSAASSARQSPTARQSGVAVIRGVRVRDVPTTTPGDAPPARIGPIVTGGRNLWFVDPATNRVVGCSLLYTIYGERTVRCAASEY